MATVYLDEMSSYLTDIFQKGRIPLVVTVDKADHMASLLVLKTEVEKKTGKTLRMAFARAAEAHLLAKEIAAADVGVILLRPRPYPYTYDEQRLVPGPPLTEETSISVLLGKNVTVAIGVLEEWQARNTRFDVGWVRNAFSHRDGSVGTSITDYLSFIFPLSQAALEAFGKINKEQAMALATTNLEKILDIKPHGDLVAYQGGDLMDMQSKVVAVLSEEQGEVAII